MFGLPCHSDRSLGTLQITLSAVVKGLSTNSRRSLKELPRSLRARGRIEDHDQRLDREVIEGTDAPSSRDGTGNEPPSRTAELSVGEEQPPREQSDDGDMADPDNDRRRPREPVGEERETKESKDQRLRWRKKAMNVWRPKRNGCESTVVPGEICSLPEWTGSRKFRKSWEVLSEQTKPSAEDDFARDVKCDILDLRPTPAARQGVERQR